MKKFERVYEQEQAFLRETECAALKAAGVRFEDEETAMAAKLAERAVDVAVRPGRLRRLQRQLEAKFDTADLNFLRATRPRHPLVRAALAAAYKVRKVSAAAAIQRERYFAALRAPLPRHRKRLQRVFGTEDLNKARWISHNRFYSAAIAGAVA